MKKYKYILARPFSPSFIIGLCLFSSVCWSSCQKYLDAKPNQSIATPSTIEDLEGIINAYSVINAKYPSASEVASDDFYLNEADFNNLIDIQRFFYSWQKAPNFVADYTSPYSAIEYVNIVLEALPKITGSLDRKNIIQGNSLFVRGAYHYALSQLYAKPFNLATASTDLGIALRLTSDIAVKPFRYTILETYSSIIADLKNAIVLLPAKPGLKYKASKPAAYGMLARVYLSMNDYKNAALFADSALSLYNTLIDYNTLNSGAAIPFSQFNDEVIYDARTAAPQALSPSRAKVDTVLFTSYNANDLRKSILFKAIANGSRAFKGNYTGIAGANLFTGIATDELYLIKAQTAVRNGETDKALSVLNELLKNRWKTGTYIPYATKDPDGLLYIILQERRKELLFRTLRWTDLRRLNIDPKKAKTLTREIGGTKFILEPNGLRYVFQIDQNAVNISGLPQNP
jgi:hypothetical protein